MITSFHRVTNQVLCTQCVYEKNITEEEMVIFPGAIRRIKERISDAICLNSQKRLELNFIMERLTEI